jgi:putative DNA primase/helicase
MADTHNSERPQTIQGDLRNLPGAIAPLTKLPYWVLWRWERPKKDSNKWTKVPYQPSGAKAKNNDPATWSPYAAVIAVVDRYDGIGFVLFEHGAFDLDKIRDLNTGTIAPWAQKLIDDSQSYAEITVSGTGLRIIGTVTGNETHRKWPIENGMSLEAYRRTRRYITISGNQLPGTPSLLADIDQVIDDTVAQLDEKNKGEKTSASSGSTDDSTAEIPSTLAALLHIPNKGAGIPHGGYASRNELAFAFITAALHRLVSDEAVIAACLDTAYEGCAIFEHCRDNGGRAYVERQLEHAREKAGEFRSEMATDLGNARRLVRFHGSDLRYVHAWKSWLAWQDGHWRRDDDEAIMRMAKATVEQMHAEAMRINDEAVRASLRKHALTSQNAQRLTAMVKLAQSELEVVLSVERLDADPRLLGVQNGVIDLRTGKFRPPRREDYVTKRAAVAFNANAKCPNWEAFLDKIFAGDHALIEYLQRAMGYLLTGLNEEVLFVLWGTGDNGKSTFRETIFALLGDYAVGSDASMLVTTKHAGGATPDLARLCGRRLLTINETQQNDFLNEARMKFITSHDTITARNLYEAPFDFTPTHKTFLTTNHKPIVRGTDTGIWRRLHLVPFLTTIEPESRDPHFREKMLTPELSGILNWAIDGLKAYNRVGLNAPQAVASATAEYHHDMDIVGLWIEERCVRDPGSVVKTIELYHDYKQWSEKQVGFTMSTIAFGRELVSRGFERAKVDGERGIRGLKLCEAM